MNVVNVTKYSGELQVFDLNQLIGSLRRSRVTVKKFSKIQKNYVKHIKPINIY